MSSDSPFNAFAGAPHGPDAEQLSMDIRDASVDTSPLQGSKDLSDDDSVSNEYDAAEAERREREARRRPRR